jgi:hypothetical protein
MQGRAIPTHSVPTHASRRVESLLAHAGGAVFVEFLIAFLPVYVFFLCLVQLGMLFSVRLITEHAAANAARAAAVVIGDDPRRYGGERPNQISEGRGAHYAAVRNAALLSLAPLILNGTVQGVKVLFPPEEQPGANGKSGTFRLMPMGAQNVEKVRVRVEVDTACRVGFANRIACPLLGSLSRLHFQLGMPTILVRAEAVYPYQGARYEYP